MSKYKAIFNIPATVQVELDVEANNQQEALIAGEDALRKGISFDQACITRIHVDQAEFGEVIRVSAGIASEPTMPPSPVDIPQQHTVTFFAEREGKGALTKSVAANSYNEAKLLAESVLKPSSVHASAIVVDSLGYQAFKVNAARGGWEVEVQYLEGSAEFQKGVLRYSWQENEKEARRVAISMMDRPNIKKVCILDYTDRVAGPVLVRTIG
jgi:hypothetical protein